MAEIHIHQQPEPDEQPLAAVLAMFPRLAEHRLVGVIRPLEAVANVSPARLCGNGLRETSEQQPRMRSPYETLGYSGISFVVNL
jgi:hypothetical protein